MEEARLNAIFNEALDDDYDNIMDRVVDHVNYRGGDDNSGSGGDGDDGANDDDDTDDDDTDDDHDDDNDDNDDDEESFWKRAFDRKKLAVCTAGALNMYYVNHIHQEPCMVSYNTGMRWLTEVLRGHWQRCVNMFRMDTSTLLSLCSDLETTYGLKPSRRMSVIEKVAIFLYTIALGASNREVQERFQHLGETISRCIKEVLAAVCLFAVDVIKPDDPSFSNTPREIVMNPKYMPHFKNCIGAIDGTHVRACISTENQIPFIGRKGVPTQNIMAACNFDMQFTFVWAGWEGSAHDTRIFHEAIENINIKFPTPPEGKYYLVDAGYPNEYDYLGPYKGERYHLQDFRRREQPRNRQEVFNRAHSSLRNVIERSFGVWKQRWRILQNMPAYPYKTQVEFVVASMALHNYIRRRSHDDVAFAKFDRNPSYVPDDILPDVVARPESIGNNRQSRMNFKRDGIADSLMEE